MLSVNNDPAGIQQLAETDAAGFPSEQRVIPWSLTFLTT
jgi:hypothetical protein